MLSRNDMTVLMQQVDVREAIKLTGNRLGLFFRWDRWLNDTSGQARNKEENSHANGDDSMFDV